jgi:hypothetical protein
MGGLQGGVFQGGQDVLLFQKRVILKNLRVGCPGAEKTENIGHPYAIPPDTGAAAAFARLKGNSRNSLLIHSISPCVRKPIYLCGFCKRHEDFNRFERYEYFISPTLQRWNDQMWSVIDYFTPGDPMQLKIM